ncbi:DEAD/DEAH box helicase [Ruminococcus sp.]|uniref:DEAD/DEAH box helicase n=1 Tax=Ruminococcus sp. TaxID=41978 RepID=UPI0025FD83F6|nr:DEAD/DEAH box helicase [Ruminococcus sp.]
MENLIEQTDFVKGKFSRYLRSTFDIRDNTYNKLYSQRLDELESKLYKGPYLASTLPFEPSKTLNELISEGALENDFNKIGGKNPENDDYLDFNRPCYAHQIKAFERLRNGHNIVVTTGTGSGKTECFMFPIINELIKEYNSGNRAPGVRAIFLFPLNALVYDQIDRLRGLLQNCPELRFGFYTGRTPEDEKSAEGRRMIGLYRQKYGEPSPNEVLTRERMRENPPQILFTNYSMLEYLLIRPTDSSLISSEALKNLRFLVLDEAHIYRGALGIEISLLLRRLQGTSNKCPQFVLTSATLGRGKEDLPKIIDFASKLTSGSFEEDDIIFGIRHNNSVPDEYSIIPQDYISLLKNLDDLSSLRLIFEKYRPYNDLISVESNIYILLLHDQNSQMLFHLTKNVGLFMEVMRNLQGFDIDALTSLIELISKAKSNDSKFSIKLYDIKYHMFMKAPDGAFVTIGNNKDLSLTVVNQLAGYKAFKIGICQNCKVPYIMGITENNILCIDDEIDIDESYADKAKRLEYYLIADCLTKEEINDLENDLHFEKYYICAKCGYLRKANSALTKSDCDHFDSFKTVIYKYKGKDELELDDDDVITNNIHRCPICDYKSNLGGVIMGFHVGKDRATSLLAQILYDSMEYPTKKEKASEFSLFKKQEKIIRLRKQFLAFSDSRQQAAFFSKFLNANNDRFLKKALIWNLLKDNDHNKISYISLVSQLSDTFQKKLFYTDEEAIKHAKAAALWELLLVDGRNSGEGIGLFAFKLDLERGNYINDEELENALKVKGFDNVTASQFRDITAQVLTIFRTAPSIEYEALATDNLEEKKELLGYRQRSIFISLQETKKKNGDKPQYYPVRSFLPVEDDSSKKSATNNIVKYVKKALGYETDKAKDFLRIVFEFAKDEGILVPNTNPEYSNTYLIKATDYHIYSYKHLTFYKCKKCNKLTLYNVNAKCTVADCDGELESCNIDNEPIYKNNYYRNEYINRPIENLICREHTAQINANEAKKIQDDFKNGRINFISCSTTFEMGIDLGGLNTVFMRNVPPTPANYAQRAGRAGRRANTSAFILTFCSTTSHDYTYFSEPQEMIRGLVKPPYFVIDNDKIIMRHITATALSLYFREPEYQSDFDTVEHYLNEDVTSKFMSYINGRPAKLGTIIDKFVLKTADLIEKYGNFKWIGYLEQSENALKSMCEGLTSLIKLYKEARQYASDQRQWSLCKSYDEALNRLNTRNSLITYFTKYNVIPGYGFPVNNVELYIYDYAKQDMSDDYNLSRDLSIAISEYAPGSEIIVDEKKYTSRYIFLPHNGYSLPTTYYCECEKCHTINTNPDKNKFVPGCSCKYCKTALDTSSKKVKSYITPIFGFVADRKNKDTKRMKPFKTYSGDIHYIGDSLSTSKELNSVVEVTEHRNEELLILNENNFFFCTSCGYTDLDKKHMLSTKKYSHSEYRGKKCTACGDKLNLIHLGHSYRTDIIQIGFNNIPEMHDQDTAISVLFAILEGISMSYDIERNDISGLVYSINPAKPYDLILFDTVSGGAGHVKRLKEDDSLLEVLVNALKKVSQDCCAEDTSCYNCLRTYNNQRLHNHIKRGLAKNALENIIHKIQDSNTHYRLSKPSFNFESMDPWVVCNSGLIDDESSLTLLGVLFKELERCNAPMPTGFAFTLSSADNDEIENADFAWVNKNILLFTIANIESYNKMVNSQNDFKCYLLTESFDYVAFTAEVNE